MAHTDKHKFAQPGYGHGGILLSRRNRNRVLTGSVPFWRDDDWLMGGESDRSTRGRTGGVKGERRRIKRAERQQWRREAQNAF